MNPAAEQPAADRILLVPLDGSPGAEAALAPAERLAGVLGAGLVVLSVVSQPEQAAAAEAYLASVAERVGVPVRSVVRTGKPTEVIADAAGELGVALVVLTTAAEGAESGHLGGVAERLARTLRGSALFVPPSYAADSPLAGPVLIAVHRTAASETGIEPGVELAVVLGSPVTLVQVVPWAEGLFANFLGVPPPNADEEIELGSNQYLAELAERLSSRVPADYQTLRGRAADMLVEYADSVGGWLVLASHAHHGPHIWRLGSTSDKVLRASHAPVLIVRVEAANTVAEALEPANAPSPRIPEQ